MVSATQITAVPPAAAAGPVAVTVTTPGGDTSGDVFYYYLSAPQLSDITPDSGPTAGGGAVVLTGSHLSAATAVHFGAAAATSTVVVSDTRIDAVAPAGAAGAVPVTVTAPGGTSNGHFYLYVAPPVVGALTPNEGDLAGGNTVTVTGTHLTGTTAVKFASVFAGFTVVSDNLLTTSVPPGPAGVVSVTVTTPGGTSSGLPYTRLAPPAI